ncbi:TIR domain-containing protein [Paenimyroides tangerinum]|uniref:TIR domain-containing protein n=1 Tax=Paenimyroides tangerinum TaxID=2488728 RepID=A0A3P3W786_9FLAO|nr:TIR domain-containing protein [Paenimyroides tangerinum]RRJ89836.1 TIR domain-containing protein [Paenimyroides tangerinum]
MAKNYKIFISHSWSYSDDLTDLQNLLNSRGYFNVEFTEASKDVPINSENATYIKARLKAKISSSDVVLALAGIYASHSEWMPWELDTAKSLNIPIIGIIPRGQERISQEVYSRSVVDVKWNTESIVEAIRNHVK